MLLRPQITGNDIAPYKINSASDQYSKVCHQIGDQNHSLHPKLNVFFNQPKLKRRQTGANDESQVKSSRNFQPLRCDNIRHLGF